MHLLDKYFVPFYQVAEPVNPEPAPAPVVATEPVVEPPAPEPTPSPAPQPGPARMVPVGVVADLREKKRELESRNEQLQRELGEARALAERLAKTNPDPAGTVVPPAAPRASAPTSDDEINRRAAEIVFAQNAQRVSESGFKEYGQQWNDTIAALNAYGINTPDFVASVMEIDQAKTHEIMHAIAQDGEKAIALANMSPARRIAEITRMAMTAPAAASPTPRNPDGTFAPTPPPAAPKEPPRQVSKAPAPPPPVEPSATKIVDWRSDEASEEEFTRGFNEMLEKRAKRR